MLSLAVLASVVSPKGLIHLLDGILPEVLNYFLMVE